MTEPLSEPEWMRAVDSVTFIGGATEYAVGARMRRSGAFLWITMTWESEITAFEPERLAVFEHVGGSLKGESRWELSPTESGCRVTLSSTGLAPGPLAWVPALAAAGGRIGLRSDLSRLKSVAEAASAE